jgi:hypothetical protein
MLVGSYFDQSKLIPVDNAVIKSDINIVSKSGDATLFDIMLDLRGKTENNDRKYKYLLGAIAHHQDEMRKVLDVISEDLVVRIKYQIEEIRTGTVIKKTQETVRITERNFFQENSNSHHIFETVILSTGRGMSFSTVNVNHHGARNLVLRITEVDVYAPFINIHKFPLPVASEGDVKFSKDGKWDRKEYERFNAPESNILDKFDSFHDHRDFVPVYHGGVHTNHKHCPPGTFHFDSDMKDHHDKFYEFNDDYSLIKLNQTHIRFDDADLLHIANIQFNSVLNGVHFGEKLVFKVSFWDNSPIIVRDASDLASALKVKKGDGYLIDRVEALERQVHHLESEIAVRDLKLASMANQLDNDVLRKDFAGKLGNMILGDLKIFSVSEKGVVFQKDYIDIADDKTSSSTIDLTGDGNIYFAPVHDMSGALLGYKIKSKNMGMDREEFDRYFRENLISHLRRLDKRLAHEIDSTDPEFNLGSER